MDRTMRTLSCSVVLRALVCTALLGATLAAIAQKIAWKRYTVGASHASMELAAPPKVKRALIEGDALKTLIFQENSNSLGPGFFVLVSYAEYQPGRRPDLKTALKGLAGNLYDASKGHAKSVVKSTKVSGKNAILQTVSYESNGQQQGLKQLLIAEGNKFWQVAVAYPANSQAGAAAADHVLGSVAIK